MVLKVDRVRTSLWLAAVSACAVIFYLYSFVFLDYAETRQLRLINAEHNTDKQRWVQTLIDAPIDGAYKPDGLKDLCGRTRWQPEIMFSCTKLDGGITNVRNIALNCIRFTIEAGGSLIMPKIIARNKDDVDKWGGEIPFDTFFDVENFKQTFARDCPQLKIYESLDSLYNVPSIAIPLELSPADLSEEYFYGWRITKDIAEWRGRFDQWMVEKLNTTEYIEMQFKPSAETPIRVNMNYPIFNFPIHYDSDSMWRYFGQTLRFREDILRITGHVMYALNEKFKMGIDPAGGISKGKYFGAHLRTDPDAEHAGWRGWEYQAGVYLNQSHEANLSVLYVASGDKEGVERLAQVAMKNYTITVINKYDLLEGAELEELSHLTWDQQGCIDYEVLLRASAFGGIMESSFSWALGLRRNIVSGLSLEKALNSEDPEKQYTIVDPLSIVYGNKGAFPFFTRTMWP